MTVIVTGAAGYIGSHVVATLLDQGERVVGLDNLSTGQESFIDSRIDFRKIDITNFDELYESLRGLTGTPNLAVIHAAGIKFAGESVKKPLEFYNTNFTGTLNILRAMELIEAENLVFSSSCSVYGNLDGETGVREDSLLAPVSPYGKSKLFAENAIQDFVNSGKIKATSLRYFNVAGNGQSRGYDASPFNLFPNIYRAIQNKVPINIFGNNFATRDGTCIRDYVDVCELAEAHSATLNLMRQNKKLKPAYNLGSGDGATVMEIVHGAQQLIDSSLRINILTPRLGDPHSILADISNAKVDLGWKHEANIKRMLQNGWSAWQRNR